MSLETIRNYLNDNPLVVFTADQDWAPEWACEVFLSEIKANELPVHVFRTNMSPTLDGAVNDGHITHGWHPNFKANSTHGSSISEVISTMQAINPDSRTVRAHSYFESSETWDSLYAAGQIVESHGVTMFEENLQPIRMASNLIRVPVFFEDDVFMRDSPDELDCALLFKRLLSPGLKVLDFHPIHIGLNSKSLIHYEQSREILNNEESFLESMNHRGIRTVMNDLVKYIKLHNVQIICFEKLVDQLLVDHVSEK
jgi:hypothetical protein